jgi:universal stress family protein
MLKKILFPIGAGNDIKQRINGALQVAKHFNTHIEILFCQLDPSVIYNMKMTLRGGVLYEQFLKAANDELDDERKKNERDFEELCALYDIKIAPAGSVEGASASMLTKCGKRSDLVARESQFCDMVVAAVPLDGKITGTFEAAIIRSGKPAIAIPRNLNKFSADSILMSWTGTTQSSKALTNSIPLLKAAKNVYCITSVANVGELSQDSLDGLKRYLELHGIKANYEIVNTTSIPGEALLKAAHDRGCDMIVAGRYGENGIREIVLGGTSKYFLANTDIPVFL